MVSSFGNGCDKNDGRVAAPTCQPHAFSPDIDSFARQARRGPASLRAASARLRAMESGGSQLLGVLQQQMQGDSM